MNARSVAALLLLLVAAGLGLASVDVLVSPWLLDMPPIPLGTTGSPGLTIPAAWAAPFAAAGVAGMGVLMAVAALILWRTEASSWNARRRAEAEREPLLDAALDAGFGRLTELLLEAPAALGGPQKRSRLRVEAEGALLSAGLDPTRRHVLSVFLHALEQEPPRPQHGLVRSEGTQDVVRLRTRLAIVGLISLGVIVGGMAVVSAATASLVDLPALVLGVPSPRHAGLFVLVAWGPLAALAFAAAGGLHLLQRRDEAAWSARRAARRVTEARRLQLYRVRVEELETLLHTQSAATARLLLAAHTRALLVDIDPGAAAEVVRVLYHRGLLSAGAALDLDGVSLRGTDLADQRLPGIDLAGVDLRHARLAGCDLAGARLAGADLEAADLRRADLRGADLAGARLQGARLQRADLREACLRGADIGGANLWQARTSVEVPS